MNSERISIQNIPLENSFIQLDLLRADQIHPHISGNKWWKLNKNVQKAKTRGKIGIISFGGAYSNHIYALAHAAADNGLSSVGIIRGEELEHQTLNATLRTAGEKGMSFHFISREEYRYKENSPTVKKILTQYPDYQLIPEGGTNLCAVESVAQAMEPYISDYDFICSAVGTGGTLAGISLAAQTGQKVIGFPVLKNAQFLQNDIQKFTPKENFQLDLRYHFGGYGKYNAILEQFLQDFYLKYQIELDLIYTGKMMYGILENISNKAYPENSKILAIHTGGLQGNQGKIQFK